MSDLREQTKKLTLCAVMAAVYVGLDFIAFAVSAPLGGTMKISFSGLPVIIVAVLCGPLWGAATGFVGAFIGQLLSYGLTVTTVLWVLPAVVRGLVFGLLFIAFKKSLKFAPLCVATVVSSLFVTAFNTLAMYLDAKIFKYPVVILGIGLINRIVVGVLTAVVFAVIVPPIIKLINRIYKR